MAIDGINIAEKSICATQRLRFDTAASVNVLEENLTSSTNWIFAGMILAARTGLDYRRMNTGQIDQIEFSRNLRSNSAGTVGSVLGSIAGMAIGIPLGGYLANTIGAVIGGVTLGISGGVAAERVFVTAEQALEEMLQVNQEQALSRQSTVLNRERVTIFLRNTCNSRLSRI